MTNDDVQDDMAELEAMLADESEPPVPDMGEGPFAKFFKLGAGGVVNLFGDTGVGKSKMAIQIAIDAANRGYNAYYADLEGNIHQTVIEDMIYAGVSYIPEARLGKVRKTMKKAPFDLLIIDSVTHHITGMWFETNQHEHGKLLQEVQNFVFWLREKARERNALAVIISQPVSDFGGRSLSPMGDKMGFFCKETYYLEQKDEKDPSKGTAKVFKSRVLPRNLLVAEYETERVGVKFIKWAGSIQRL
jgi:RecA/RadA recombinase